MAKQEKMFALVERWQRSGVSKAEFARQTNLTLNTFYYWCRLTPCGPLQSPKSTARRGRLASESVVALPRNHWSASLGIGGRNRRNTHGRKNYLFAGSHDGAINIAMYRSFLGTCRLNDIDPRAWLLYVLRHIRSTAESELHTLLPQSIDHSLLA